jgi:hypothetical protein
MPYAPPTGLANGASGQNVVTITGADINVYVRAGMLISFGSREVLSAPIYIIQSVAPSGTTGGTVTLQGNLASTLTNSPFAVLVDQSGPGDTYNTAMIAHAMGRLVSLLGASTSISAQSRQIALDKQTSGAVAQILWQIAGIDQFRIRQVTEIVSGSSVECLSIEATTDGTTWAQALRVRKDTGAVTFGASSVILPSHNLLINSLGMINQRGYVSGTATVSANQYTIDRWRVVESGQSLSWTHSAGVRTMTAPAGGVEQVIESVNVLSGTYKISWSGTATCLVGGSAVTNGAEVTLTGGANVTIRFSGGTFSKPWLSQGSGFLARAYTEELALCQRYFAKTYSDGTAPATATFAGASLDLGRNDGRAVFTFEHPVEMRTSPTITFYSTSGTVGKYRDTTGAVDRTAAVAAASTRRVAAYASEAGAAAGYLYMHFVCSAEI